MPSIPAPIPISRPWAHRNLILLGLSVLAFGLSGCGKAIRISHGSGVKNIRPGKTPGIPFYIKKAACKHEMIWLEPIFLVKLQRITPVQKPPKNDPGGTQPQDDSTTKEAQTKKKDAPQPDSKSGTKDVSSEKNAGAQPVDKSTPKGEQSSVTTETPAIALPLSAFEPRDPSAPSLKKLMIHVAKGDDSGIEGEWGTLVANAINPTGSGFPSTENRILVLNQSSSEVYVDYADPYYYNAKIPVVGSVNASAELAADGTLNKGSSQVEEKTLQSFLNLLPVKDVLSSVAKGALGGAKPPTLEAANIRYGLAINLKVFKHTRSVLEPTASLPCESGPIDLASFDDMGNPSASTGTARKFLQYRYSREEITSASEEKSGSKIKFSGAVDVPEKPAGEDKKK